MSKVYEGRSHINNLLKKKLLSNSMSMILNMARKVIKMSKCTCERCGHTWTSRIIKPRTCPKCKSALWDIVKEEKKDEAKK